MIAIFPSRTHHLPMSIYSSIDKHCKNESNLISADFQNKMDGDHGTIQSVSKQRYNREREGLHHLGVVWAEIQSLLSTSWLLAALKGNPSSHFFMKKLVPRDWLVILFKKAK